MKAALELAKTVLLILLITFALVWCLDVFFFGFDRPGLFT